MPPALPLLAMFTMDVSAWWLTIAVMTAGTLLAGFAAGVLCAPGLHAWWLNRSCRQLRKLFETTLAELNRAAELCQQLQQRQPRSLSAAEWSQFDRSQQRLVAMLDELREFRLDAITQTGLLTAESLGEPAAPTVVAARAFEIHWERAAVDPTGRLPDRAAFEHNLQRVIAAGQQHHQSSGLLLIKLDKAEHLAQRFGAELVAALTQQLTETIRHTVRPIDLVTQWSDQQWAVLVPSVSPMSGARLADTVRTAVRQHRFVLAPNGPEFVVTASFGYSPILPAEPQGLSVDRAEQALAKSQAAGRNQLHMHEAVRPVVTRLA
jgi:diguanylate cyclase (GGDEF)-like protein